MTTPIEKYGDIYVKRDDLCFPSPAPPFSKCRGLMLHLKKLKAMGITTVGYTETSISMAGWGVAWACKELGMQAIIFDPQYNSSSEALDVLAYHREQWKKFGAIIIPIKAGMAKVNYYIGLNYLKRYKKSVMLPLGLPFEETIEATKKEVMETWINIPVQFHSVVSCVGSGTIAAGIWRGLEQIKADCSLYGIMTRTGDLFKKRQSIEHKAGLSSDGFFKSTITFNLIDLGWEYTEKSNAECPFPCHTYYDLKAWEWLINNKGLVKKPILFWNIGSNV